MCVCVKYYICLYLATWADAHLTNCNLCVVRSDLVKPAMSRYFTIPTQHDYYRQTCNTVCVMYKICTSQTSFTLVDRICWLVLCFTV